MHRNNNTNLFDKSVIDLLKKKKSFMSVSDISVELKKILPDSELPPKGHFLQWMDRIKCLTRNDILKKDMPFFNYSDKEIEIKKVVSEEEIFLKKYRKDFYIWLNNFKKYKNSESTNYKMWDDLKKDYDLCLENLRIIKTTYPKLQDTISGLRLKKMPIEVDCTNSTKSINIEYKPILLYKKKADPLQKMEPQISIKPVIDLSSIQKSELSMEKPVIDLSKIQTSELSMEEPPGLSKSYLNLNIPIDTNSKSILGLSYDKTYRSNILVEKKQDTMPIWQELGLNIQKEKEVNKYELSYLLNKDPYYDLSYESKFLNTSTYNHPTQSHQQPAPVYQQQSAPVYQQQSAPVYQQQSAPVYQQQSAPVYQQSVPVYQQSAPVYQQQPARDYQQQQTPVYQQQQTPVYQQQQTPVYQQQQTPVYQQQQTPVYQQQQPTPVYQQQSSPVLNSNLDYNALPYTPTSLSSISNTVSNPILINQIKNELSKLDSTQIAIVVTKLLEAKKENFNSPF